MRFAQARYQENADRHRVAAPAFQPGDQVWLNAKNIRTSRPSRKLDNKRLGPFTVDTAVGTHAYRLLLPDTMKVHPVFHVSLLDPARDDPLPGQQIPPPPPVIVDGEKEHEVEEVVSAVGKSAAEGWEKIGGEEAARRVMEKAVKELEGLDAGLVLRSGQGAAQVVLKGAKEGYQKVGGNDAVKEVVAGAVKAAAEKYQRVVESGAVQEAVVAVGEAVGDARDWAAQNFAGWF